MDVSKLSLQQLHEGLQAIKLQPKKPYQKYPKDVSLMVNEAFRRGMSLKEIQSLSEMPNPTLRHIHQKIIGGRSVPASEPKTIKPQAGSKGFIKIKVEDVDLSQTKETKGDRVFVRVDASGLTFEIGVDSLTPTLLQTLRSIL